ncbi:hypothetical protein LOAG_00147 [Loa loa]|uniref:Uncharacterized protein n=1 Tax=Loa loa TaxID=7209 RepID=A0A1S0UBW1_LOALO|nr:hypothetical protein LOAG_00147 [Loa loa]EFO28328.1 hypothetical protein LOAG_00147 [Loa loa]
MVCMNSGADEVAVKVRQNTPCTLLGISLAAIGLFQLRCAYFELEASGATLMSRWPTELYNHPSITCMYIYIHIHTQTDTHTHIHTYICASQILPMLMFGTLRLPISLDECRKMWQTASAITQSIPVLTSAHFYGHLR